MTAINAYKAVELNVLTGSGSSATKSHGAGKAYRAVSGREQSVILQEKFKSKKGMAVGPFRNWNDCISDKNSPG